MRKYQQLLLLLISCSSVAVLLIYKSENTRLKYVLRVVNFFGRNDDVILRHLENSTKIEAPQFAYPLPLWQAIGEDFYAYNAFWNRNELMAGGEALATVAGKRGAVVSFRCNLFYNGGSRSIQGKFTFQRVDAEFEDAGSEFTSYNFFCRIIRDFGQPERVSFTNINTPSKTPFNLRLRFVKPVQPDKDKDPAPATQLATICVDLVSYNTSSSFFQKDTNVLQFFVHHHILGFEHFLVYNSEEMPRRVIQQLKRISTLSIHEMPFNFPFGRANTTQRLRRVVEADCLMRNMHIARHTILLTPDEFFYPNAQINAANSVLKSLHHYPADTNRFQLNTFSVCTDDERQLLYDNALYDPELKAPHPVFIYRPHVAISSLGPDVSHSVVLSLSLALSHRYTKCEFVGGDGLHDWRNSLREDFIQYIQTVRNALEVWFENLKAARTR